MFLSRPCRLKRDALFFASLLSSLTALADQEIRVATWNVLTVGEPGSDQYEAAYAVLHRLGADVVAVQEVASNADATYMVQMAVDLGYPHVTVAPAGPFGALRTAVMSDYELAPGVSWTAATLAADPQANDITRYILQADVDLTGNADVLSVIVTHWKSGSGNTDEFRRSIESRRVGQVVDRIADPDQPYILLGDVNADIGDGQQTPTQFTSIPSDLPASFVTGADMLNLVTGQGLPNDTFAPLTDRASMVDAKQVDSNDATRPESGRRLDYLFISDGILTQGAQVYDCADEGLIGSLPLQGAPLAESVCPTASDHLPVFADLVIRSGQTNPPFADVPASSWAYGYIHAIRDAGITTGCGNNNYCPSNFVTRDQMAAFLIRAIEGDPETDLCAAGSPFSDVAAGAWYCSHVKRLVDQGITAGCGGDKYCPGNQVTREQMAAFIIRAVEGEPMINHCAEGAPFADVPATAWSCSHIKRLVDRGITLGCGGNHYCPQALVSREQMAAFLARAFLHGQ